MDRFDIAVIGGGPGGYVAALQAAKSGRRVALIEADELGGTCLNRGCVPSKTWLSHAEMLEQIGRAKEWGIKVGEVSFSFEQMVKRKDQIVKGLRSGIASLLKADQVSFYQGYATVDPDGAINVNGPSGMQQIKAEKVILATGSSPIIPPIPGLDKVFVHTSDTIFQIEDVPKSIAIIGGGVIGVEFACIFAMLNVKVTVIELAERIIPTEDEDASAVLLQALKKKGIRVLTGHQVMSLAQDPEQKLLTVRTPHGEMEEIAVDQVLVSVGRKANLGGLERLGVEMNGAFIRVNERMETNLPNIYAVGDVIGGKMLAHVAIAEGLVAAKNASGAEETVNYRAVPRCIYTFPQVASVGYTEKEAEQLGYRVKKMSFPLRSNAIAITLNQIEGFIKVMVDEKYGEILGAVMVGPHVTEMISEASAFISLEGTVEELAKMIHPHPTLSEGLFEAAAALTGEGIHLLAPGRR